MQFSACTKWILLSRSAGGSSQLRRIPPFGILIIVAVAVVLRGEGHLNFNDGFTLHTFPQMPALPLEMGLGGNPLRV